jgi:hypothetical protein
MKNQGLIAWPEQFYERCAAFFCTIFKNTLSFTFITKIDLEASHCPGYLYVSWCNGPKAGHGGLPET